MGVDASVTVRVEGALGQAWRTRALRSPPGRGPEGSPAAATAESAPPDAPPVGAADSVGEGPAPPACPVGNWPPPPGVGEDLEDLPLLDWVAECLR
eukprot:12039544-Alexandrium_andersonii.AAC.1